MTDAHDLTRALGGTKGRNYGGASIPVCQPDDETPCAKRKRRPRSSFGNLIDPRHLAVTRAVGYCLTLLDDAATFQLSAVIYARLRPSERAFLAVAALRALNDDEYDAVLDFMEGRP